MRSRQKAHLNITRTVASLEYAAGCYAWGNVHSVMKPAMTSLIRRGLAIRRKSDEAFELTEAGQELHAANKHHIEQLAVKAAVLLGLGIRLPD